LHHNVLRAICSVSASECGTNGMLCPVVYERATCTHPSKRPLTRRLHDCSNRAEKNTNGGGAAADPFRTRRARCGPPPASRVLRIALRDRPRLGNLMQAALAVNIMGVGSASSTG
jgi:hypothetical protein